jgi:hypothetical protein
VKFFIVITKLKLIKVLLFDPVNQESVVTKKSRVSIRLLILVKLGTVFLLKLVNLLSVILHMELDVE